MQPPRLSLTRLTRAIQARNIVITVKLQYFCVETYGDICDNWTRGTTTHLIASEEVSIIWLIVSVGQSDWELGIGDTQSEHTFMFYFFVFLLLLWVTTLLF